MTARRLEGARKARGSVDAIHGEAYKRRQRVETYNVINVVAALAIGLVVVRAIQAGVEHYFPGSEPAVVLRFIFGGP